MPEIQNLRSEAVQDILTKIPHWTIRWGNVAILVILLLFMSFSWLIKYPDVINSEALLTTQLPPQKEYANQGGKLSHIFVQNKQEVTISQDLAVIENTANYQDVQFLKILIDTITYTKEQFDFPLDQVPLLFLGEIDAAYAAFENSYLAYNHNRRIKPFNNTRTSQKFTGKELQYRLNTLINQKESQRNELNLQKSDLDRSKTLYDKGVIALREYEQKQMQFIQAERNFKNVNNSISQIKESITTSNSNYRIEESNNDSENISLLRNTIQSFNQLKKAIYDWEMRYVLRSEVTGTVSFLDFWSINQVVNSGDLLFIIIPSDNQKHLAKLKVPAFNSGKLAIGQKVFLKLDNYQDTEYGRLESQIAHISAIPNKDGNYLIDVVLPEKLITTYGKEIPFQTEMTGSAEIVTEDLRLVERFFYQIKGIFG